MAQPAWLNKYLVMKPEIERVFDELDTYLDFCRFELRDYNPAHLYDKSNQNYRAFLDSQRPRKDWGNRSNNFRNKRDRS